MTDTEGRIRFAADILRRLGEELNPSIDQGIIELVKNAYDADASTCTVTIISSKETDSVTVVDDGYGMDAQAVINGWLVLGSSQKETSNRTPLGRTPAGNKGLGRLAALRLGDVARLETRTATTHTEVEIFWRRFDTVSTVDEVAIPIVTSATRPDLPPGTEIELRELRKRIGRMDVKRLARAMILLADPFNDVDASFSPKLVAPDHEDLSQLVSSRYFDEAEYHLIAELREGRISARVEDWKGQMLYNGHHRDIRGDDGIYDLPDAEFDLWAFSLDSRTFVTRTASLTEVREWLTQFGGVHVYTNGLRVAPYGNPGNDWLDINVARAKSPEERPSTNNSIGRVSITDPTAQLSQKTDRTGFIEDETFEQLRAFSIDALNWMARQRMAAAEARRRKARAETAARSKSSEERVETELQKIEPNSRPQLETAFRQYAQERDREANVLRSEVQLYRTLSTAGITTATFAHETNGGPLKIISQSIASIRRRARRVDPNGFDETFARPIESVERATSTLNVLAQATLRLVDQDKRRVGRVDLNKVVRQTLETLDPFFAGRDVRALSQITDGNPYLRGSEAAVESILTNLLNNSVVAFERSTARERTIRVSTEVENQQWTLTVDDNGPGIEGISVREVWLPGESRRPGGTGLGLTIVRDAVSDLSGSVRAEATGPLGGARFSITLPILGR